MGRHEKRGLDYFNIDCHQEDNLTLVEAKHGIEGYGVVIKLWKKAYSIQGYFCEWDEKNQYLFAKETGVKIEILKDIVETCFAEDIFHEGLYKRYKILTSSGIQKRWLKIIALCKRKDCEIDPILEVSTFIPEVSTFIPEEMAKTPVVIPQRKGKERKGKEIKGKERKDSGADAPDEIWPLVVKTWFDFYKAKFGDEPSFDGRIASDFKKLIGRLEKRVIDKGFPWDFLNAPGHFGKFLDVAFKDTWLANNFLVQNLLSQFDKIIANGKNGTVNGKKPTGGEVSTESMAAKIAYLTKLDGGAGVASGR